MAVDVARPPVSPAQTGSSRSAAVLVIGTLTAIALVVRVADPESVDASRVTGIARPQHPYLTP